MDRIGIFATLWVRLLAAVCVAGVGAASSIGCTVDKGNLTFDDEEYAELASAGGGQSAAGGSGSGGSATGGDGAGGDSGAACKSGELSCAGRQVQLCSGGQLVDVGAPCEFVCDQGQCVGVCAPDATQCASDVEVQTCDASGAWQSSFCEFTCVGDGCGGACRPGTSRCGGPEGLSIETCDTTGQWVETGTICAGACDMAQCTGSCVNGETQCAVEGDKPAELTCVGGSWENGTISSCEYVCLSGKCSGECIPLTKQCVQGAQGELRSQACDAQGQWIAPGTPCPFDCRDGECFGDCQPGTQKCVDANLLLCGDDFRWQLAQDCSREGLTCVALDAERRSCGQCSPGGVAASCYFTEVVSCKENGLWGSEVDCGAAGDSNIVCVGKGVCQGLSEICAMNVSAAGCLEETKGWWCDPNGTGYMTGGCDCSDGIACK